MDAISRWLRAMIGCVIFSAGTMAMIANRVGHVDIFLGAKCVQGIGTGILSLVLPVFGAEIAPTHWRGLAAGSIQRTFLLGFFLVNVLVEMDVLPTWREAFVVAAAVPILTLPAFWKIPESPRWIHARKGVVAAESALQRIGQPSSISDLMTHDAATKPLFFTRSTLQRVGLVMLLQGLHQLSGVHTVFFCGHRIARAVGQFYTLPIVFLVATIVGAVLIDKLGRRTLLLCGAVGMSLSNVAIAFTNVAVECFTDNGMFRTTGCWCGLRRAVQWHHGRGVGSIHH